MDHLDRVTRDGNRPPDNPTVGRLTDDERLRPDARRGRGKPVRLSATAVTNQAVGAVVAGRDTLAVLPTGSGKSAIYQVAGLSLGGLTLVISPLIALQRSQLRSISGRRLSADRTIGAELLNASEHAHERRDTFDRLASGGLDFLLIGPEQLTNAQTRAAIRTGARPVGLFVVDEAHLVSEWGQNSGRSISDWSTRSPSWADPPSSP